MKRIFGPGLAILIVSFGLYGWLHRGAVRDALEEARKPTLPKAVSVRQASSTIQEKETPTAPRKEVPKPKLAFPQTTTTTQVVLPKEVNLFLPFLSQAPKQDWSMPYQEACEEASMLMVKAALDGVKSITRDEGDALILDMVRKQELAGLPPDIPIAEAKAFFETTYSGYRVTIIPDLTEEKIKSWLAHGVPVIIPASGKALQNPNFRNGGPLYHMLVIKGYLADGRWITNDPGTRKGADYIYAKDILLNAIHDWNGGDVPRGSSTGFVIQAK